MALKFKTYDHQRIKNVKKIITITSHDQLKAEAFKLLKKAVELKQKDRAQNMAARTFSLNNCYRKVLIGI